MVLTDNLVAYYKLDETSGTTAVNSISEVDMTASGLDVNQEGKIGKSYLSNAATDSLTTSSATPITGNFTINVWMYRTGTGTNANCTVVEQGSHTSNSGFGFYINTSHQLAWRVNQTYNNYKAAATIPLNTWTMASLVYNGSTIKIYVNGTEVSSDNFTTNPNSSQLRRMFNREANNEAYIGRLDEVAIFSRALSPTEVTELYNSGDGLTYPFVSTPIVSTGGVSNIGTSTATVYGEVVSDNGNTITERGICYSKTSPPTISDSKVTTTGTTGEFSCVLSDLDDGTTYYAKAYAINSEGTGYGDEINFTTEEVTSLLFGPYQQAQSKSIKYKDGTITAITLVPLEIEGTFEYSATADGINWEVINKNVRHTFTNTGDNLKYKIREISSSDGEITQITIKVN